jgi:membrane protease YdiL (CAAX protease family)
MDFVISFAAGWAVIIGFALIWVVRREVTIRPLWLGVSILMFATAAAALIFGARVLPVQDWIGELEVNWGGKLVGIFNAVLWVVLLWWVAKRRPSACGVTFRQAPGSVVPSLILSVVLTLFAVVAEIRVNDGVHTSAQWLWFNATLPGVDEEMIWRGAFLLTMNEAFRGEPWRLAGVEVKWGAVLACLLFGLVHGLYFHQGAWGFEATAVGMATILGFGLYWIRERTGSILIPVFAHNLINVATSFF